MYFSSIWFICMVNSFTVIISDFITYFPPWAAKLLIVFTCSTYFLFALFQGLFTPPISSIINNQKPILIQYHAHTHKCRLVGLFLILYLSSPQSTARYLKLNKQLTHLKQAHQQNKAPGYHTVSLLATWFSMLGLASQNNTTMLWWGVTEIAISLHNRIST